MGRLGVLRGARVLPQGGENDPGSMGEMAIRGASERAADAAASLVRRTLKVLAGGRVLRSGARKRRFS